MPPLPPEFYLPAFAFMATLLATLGAAFKVLWNRYLSVADRLHVYEDGAAKEATRALTLSSEALRGNAEVLGRLADYALRPAIRRRAAEQSKGAGAGPGGGD